MLLPSIAQVNQAGPFTRGAYIIYLKIPVLQKPMKKNGLALPKRNIWISSTVQNSRFTVPS